METENIKKQIEKQIEKKERELEILKAKLELQDVVYEDKNIKIIKWENKRWKDFPIPKDYYFADFNNFCNLVNSKKIKPKPYEYFVTKHPLKNNKYPLFGACLCDSGGWFAGGGGLSGSDGDGRVVIQKIKNQENDK